MKPNVLVVFTRYPEPGRTKTRMIPELGDEGAANLHREMTEFTMRSAREYSRAGGAAVEIHFASGSDARMREWLGSESEIVRQGEGDLGSRMAKAFRDVFSGGAGKVVIIGTDCPDLNRFALARTFRLLDRVDVVLGPARDGGYYLIGLRRDSPDLFDGILWGTDGVFDATVRRARATGRRVGLLPPLDDVDRPRDLPVWEAARERMTFSAEERISVVIPALNEAAGIARAVSGALEESNVEVIVADGGSRDGTVEIANRKGATVFPVSRGRAVQLNAGADIATGSAIVFLHADSVLPVGFAGAVREALERPAVALGAFSLAIDGPGPGLRITEFTANLRARLLELPYGDQALFVRAGDFVEAGRFPAWPLLEDVGFVRNLRRKGRISILGRSTTTSARRWRRLGVLRTMIINSLVVGAFLLGVTPDRLVHLYYGGKSTGSLRREASG